MAVSRQTTNQRVITQETSSFKAGRTNPPRTLKRLLRLFRPYRVSIFLLFITILVFTIATLMVPLLIPSVFDNAIAHKNLSLLLIDAMVMVGVTIVAGIASLLQAYLNNTVGQSVMRDLRDQLYTHLQDMPLSFFTFHQAGEIQSRLSNDISGAQTAITETFTAAISQLIAIIGTIIAMLYISRLLTLISFALLPLFLWVTYRVGRARHRTTKATQQSVASLNAMMQETLSISGILLIKTFGRKEFAKARFAKENQELTNLGIRQQMVGRWFFTYVNIFFGLTPIVVYVVAGIFIIYSLPSVTVGGIIAFIMLQSRFFSPFTQLLMLQVNIQGALALFERIFEYQDLPVDIQDEPGALSLSPANVGGEIVFQDVSFSYPTSNLPQSETSAERQETLSHISFTVMPGQLVAIVGPSGAGKTTITYLLSRLYDVQKGSIAIDGHDIKHIKQSSLASLIGSVTQETYLFHTSIRENLLYVKPDATEDEIVAATTAAAIHQRILELEHGYDTIVGERGYKLSGGEKQRLAIARVLLKNPRILVLDEATSSLDTQSEHLIQLALASLMANRSTIAIAHRLSTILSADTILVLDKGKIVEQGTHHELLARSGMYAQLYKRQFEGSLEESEAGGRKQ